MSVSLLLLVFSAGILVASYLPVLPSLYTLWLLPFCFLVGLAWRWFIYFFAIALGVGWGIFSGHQLLATQLDSHLEGQTLEVSGWVMDIPDSDSHKTRFLLRVDDSAFQGNLAAKPFPETLQLSWYARGEKTQPSIIPGDYWQLNVRLKRPRGFVNPGGFDYQAWLLRRGIGATGYVVSATAVENPPSPNVLISIDKLRWQLQHWVLTHCESNECGILVALLIGDTSLVDKHQWLRMQQTGTSHLIAISGLHVGFLAIVGYWCGLLFGRLMQRLGSHTPAQRWAYSLAIIFAGFYSALAGFNIPTVRTLIMLAVFYVAAFWYRPVRLAHSYFAALSLVLLLDPLAAFDMGFWLSFGAVAVLLVSFSGRYLSTANYTTGRPFSRVKQWLWGYTRSQWVLFIGLLVPLGLLTYSSPLLAPVANFVAIPLVTFFVVPCLLLGASFALVSDNLLLLRLAEAGMKLLAHWLDLLLGFAQGDRSEIFMPVLAFNVPSVLLLILATFTLLSAPGLLPRWLGYLGLCLGITVGHLPATNPPELELTIMDVGQGTALLVSTPDHHLVYDTGPRYTEDFDAGSGILLPFLRSQGIRSLDAVVVSHSDLDHAGGLEGLTQQMNVSRIFYGEPPGSDGLNCHDQEPWQWNKVKFRFLKWPIQPGASANDRSCVLLLEYGDQRILLPGDIESNAEWILLRGNELPGKLTVLLAAHHGSRTSSNPAFVAYTRPDWVIYSAGYKNQHGHPHPQVQARFEAQGSRALSTAAQGALVLRWRPERPLEVIATRQTRRRYWHEPLPNGYVLP